MDYRVTNRVKVFKENATINDTDFAGWLCVNTGTGKIQVNKVTLQPTEGLDFTKAVPAGSLWNSPIQITMLEEGGEAVLIQLLYHPIE